MTGANPHETLAALLNGHVISRLVSIAAELGVADALKDGPAGYERVAECVGANPDSLYRAMRTLAGAGVFREVEKGVFELTPVGGLLVSDAPESQRSLATLMWAPWWRQGSDEALHSVLTGETGFDRVHGSGLFEYLRANPEAAGLFGRAMTSFTRKETEAIMKARDFSSASLVVDVGGGFGGLLSSILSANEGVRGLLYDLPYVIERAKGMLAQEGFSGRMDFREGDFFKSIPGGGDIFILKSVLHDWNDEKAGAILANCRKAMADGARLLVIERVVPEGDSPSPAKIMDIAMLVNLGGRERTLNEYSALLESAGFKMMDCIPTASPMSIIEAE